MKRAIFTLYVLLISSSIFAVEVLVQAQIDSSSLLIGNQTNLRYTVSLPAGKFVQFPFFGDTIAKGVEIIEKKKPDTVLLPDNRIEIKQDYTVSVFDSGLYIIPPAKFVVEDEVFTSNLLTLQGISLPVDTVSMAFNDIKPIMQPPFDWKEFFKIASIVVLICLILAAIVYIAIRFWKKKPILPIEKTEIQLPAHIAALQALDKIKAEKLWQHGREKEFYTQLTDVLRFYIERRFNINAMEMTSDEILQSFSSQQSLVNSQQLTVDGHQSANDYQLTTNDYRLSTDSLRQILKTADLVKFAKQKMLPNENDLSIENSYLFINKTKEVDENKLQVDELRVTSKQVPSDNS